MANVTVRRLPDGEELVLAGARPQVARLQDDLDRVRIRRPGEAEPAVPRPTPSSPPRAVDS
jgi:hypothetical protein